jgi:uncharacterized protein YndB with AHSA1/START domain
MTEIGVTRSVHMPCAPDEAWSRFTDGFADWWPREHCMCGEEALDQVYIDLGGESWGEITLDGTRVDWGRIEIAQPPGLLVLGWQMDARHAPWVPERNPSGASRVTVRFEPEGDGTRVTLTHDRFEAHGDGQKAMTDIMIGLDRWREWLALFARQQ